MTVVSTQVPADHAYAQRQFVDQLLRAASEGDEAALRSAAAALDSSVAVSEVVAAVKDAHGRGALHFAALRNQADLCTALVTQLAVPVDARDEEGDTPLALACRAGAAAAAAALLRGGADVAAVSSAGAQPIHHAAASGDASLVRALLQSGVSVTAPSPLGPPLLWCLSHAHAACCAELLAGGADASAASPDGVPALLVACLNGEEPEALACVRALLSAGADVNARARVMDDATALHVCADCGAAELAQLLLAAGADANTSEANGCTPLMLAATNGHTQLTEMLLPVTTPDARVQPWSVAAVLAAAAAGQFAQASAPCSHVAGDAAAPGQQAGVQAAKQEAGAGEQHPPPSPEAAARAEAHKTAGDAAFRSGDCSVAVGEYTTALGDDPHNATLLSNRSVARLRSGDMQGALADAQRCRQLRPRWAKAYFRLGSALHALQRFEEAAQALFEGVQLEPDNIELARAFREAVDDGRRAHQRAAKGQQQP